MRLSNPMRGHILGVSALLTIFFLSSCSFAIRDPRLQDAMLSGPLTVGVTPDAPERYVKPLLAKLAATPSLQQDGVALPVILLDQPQHARVQVTLTPLGAPGTPIMQRFFAAVTPFATVADDISLAELTARWQGAGDAPLLVTPQVHDLLSALWGATAAAVFETSVHGVVVQTSSATPGNISGSGPSSTSHVMNTEGSTTVS